MRVELLYAPGCTIHSQYRQTLEMAIADERLPIPVEMIEEAGQVNGLPSIRINGTTVNSPIHCFETLRKLLSCHWKEITERPLADS